MSFLPVVHAASDGHLVLSHHAPVARVIRALAIRYLDAPRGIAQRLADIGAMHEAVEAERHLDGRGYASPRLDQLIEDLIEDLGGSETHLDGAGDLTAIEQVRILARDADHIARTATAHLVAGPRRP